MDNHYEIQWVHEVDNDPEEVEEIITVGNTEEHQEPRDSQNGYIVTEITQLPNSIDQIAAENLIYMAQDGQVRSIDDLIEESIEVTQNEDFINQENFECVTEEVITDDWVQQQGEERVEVLIDQISANENNDFGDVPLPTDQDQYTALRPYPCDFCSRRFRKKVSLMNHMVAHQNDRPHVCNLCGLRYLRKQELINHLKTHAHIPDPTNIVEENYFGDQSNNRMNNYVIDESLKKVKPKPRDRQTKTITKYKNEIQYLESNSFDDDEDDNTDIINTGDVIEKYSITDSRKPFVCQQCGLAFAREKALSSHLRIHGINSPYECTTCSDIFWDLNSLNEHQKTHFEASNSEYEPENDEETDSEDSKYGDYYCNICGMSFHRQDLLKRHTKTHVKQEVYAEGDSGRHCCNVCGGTFAGALDLLAHAEVHARFQPFKCVLCGETFLEETTIKKHLLNLHASEMTTNSCRLCGKKCRDAKALMKHSWDHSREKNHSCSNCGKNFHNKARLKRHMVSHRNKSVECELCHEKFPDGRSLMNHRHSHSNVSGRQFSCYECGKTFGSRSSQQIHLRIHTGEKPYGCKYCWKAFADGGTLRKHERIHTGEKPYGCSVCSRAFNQRVVLREHIRAHHSSLDASRGTYYCTVCGDTLNTSTDLIQHLIQHSDINTAMHRQPITGPRKYKRRRKLKPHEIMKLRQDKSSNVDDINYSDMDMTNVDDILGLNSDSKSKKKSDYRTFTQTQNTSGRNRKYSINLEQKLMSSSTVDDSYNVVFQNLENLNNFDSLVVNTTSSPTSTTVISSVSTHLSKPKTPKRRGNKTTNEIGEKPRPKMIHTRKTRVAAEDGKRKTRTLITHTEPAQFDSNNKTSDSEIFNEFDSVVDSPERGNSNSTVIKQEQLSRSDFHDNNEQLLIDAARIRKDSDKFTPDIINDLEEILRSPIKIFSKSPSNPPITTQSDLKESITNDDTQIFTIPDNSDMTVSSSPSVRDEDVRRSARLKRASAVPSKKYLEYNLLSKKTNVKQLPNVNQEKPDKNEVQIKVEQIDDENENNDTNKDCINDITEIKIETSLFQCEMCCAVFSDNAQLLTHVPIHLF